MKTFIWIVLVTMAVSFCLVIASITHAGYGKAWYGQQDKELRLVCYSSAAGAKCVNMWVAR